VSRLISARFVGRFWLAAMIITMAIVRASSRQDAARAFIEAVMSDEGQRILEKYGFEGVR